MREKTTSVADLAGLRERLTTGIYPVMARSRDAGSSRDSQALSGMPWPARFQEALGEIRGDPWEDPSGPARAISAMSERLRADRALLITTLLAPVQALDSLESLAYSPSTKAVDSWIAMFWLAEAAWDAIGRGLPAEAGYASGETGLLTPLAARLWFLISSEPMRSRAQGNAWWQRQEADLSFGGSGLLARALGNESWPLVAGRCQDARRAWLDCLNAYQSHAYLAQASSAELEQELRRLTFRDAASRQPLGISSPALSEPASLNAADLAVLAEVTDRHLLPRFDLRRVIALALHDDDARRRRGRRVLAAIAVAAGASAAICTAVLWIHAAAWIAAGFFILVGVGVVAFGEGWAAPWLLRTPAAAAIGVIALISFLPARWQNTLLAGWIATAALATAAFGYLLLELRNHGVCGRRLGRSLAVAGIGAAQSLMVSLIGLVAVAPAFASQGRELAITWDHPGYRNAWMVLVLATFWCLAVGVFSQILWDDRPITAPLAHVSWRAGQQ
jgi:hypothetical protein